MRTLPVRRIELHRAAPPPAASWPFTIPAVRQVLDDGLDLGAMTVLVGDNGAGKSTLVEALAIAYGLNAEGGTISARHATRPSESVLGEHLQIVRSGGASKKGFFLRAETMHGLFTYLEDLGGESVSYHDRSHGESFLDVVLTRSRISGLWIFDEPESALSFSGCLALLGLFRDLLANGSQIVLSTHSPILAAATGADLYEIGEWGLRSCDYDDLDLVRNWRAFLEAPGRYTRFLD